LVRHTSGESLLLQVEHAVRVTRINAMSKVFTVCFLCDGRLF
jgi:hypothetical protein